MVYNFFFLLKRLVSVLIYRREVILEYLRKYPNITIELIDRKKPWKQGTVYNIFKNELILK
jgi:hypothetical protein